MSVGLHPGVVGGHLLQEVLRGVGIDEVVHVAVETVGGVVEAAHGEHAVEEVGPAEEEVGSVETTHGAARGDEHLLGVVLDVGQEFVGDVAKPAFVSLDAPALVAPLVRPCFPVDAVDADDAQAACLDEGCEYVYHAVVLPIEEAAVLAGKGEQGLSVVAVDFIFHFAAEVLAPPFVIL